MRNRFGLAALGLLFGNGIAHATEPLPVIVTYEMQRQSDAARVERRDPRAFWVRQIVARLEDKKPEGTIGLTQPATAKVGFVVARDGRIVSKSIEASSGVPAVDREALAMLDRAQPFPPMPQAMDGKDVAFSLPLRFR